MTAPDVKIAGVLFVLMTGTIAANLFGLRGALDTPALLETASLPPRIAAQKPSGFGLNGEHEAAQPNLAEVIRGIQRELDARGYEAGQPDGVAGLVTQAAILAYEFDYGLPLTATASQELLSRIVLGTSAPQPAAPSLGRTATEEATGVIRLAEQALAQLGYQTGKIDGQLSEETARAIREFELDQKLPESGRISGPLISRLLKLQGSPTAEPAQKLSKSAAPPPQQPSAAQAKSVKTAKPVTKPRAEKTAQKAVSSAQ